MYDSDDDIKSARPVRANTTRFRRLNGNVNYHPASAWSPWRTTIKAIKNARLFTGKIINDHRVQNCVLLLIAINAIMMGVATFPTIKNNPAIVDKFELADKSFLILFTIESSMQLIYHGINLFRDGFLVFDLLIVVMSWTLVGAQVFRAFRIFRAMRLITRINTLKKLVVALFTVFPKMMAILMLLLLIYYIFSVMFTQLFKGMYGEGLVEEPYFETVYHSLFTLFQIMTMDQWAVVLFGIQQTHSWAWIPFTVFIIVTGFVVVNLIIAVICDAVHVLENGGGGLRGYESESEYTSSGDMVVEEISNNNVNHAAKNRSRVTPRKMRELQQQMNELISVQDQMGTTIEVLTSQFVRENARSDVECTATQYDDRRPSLDYVRTIVGMIINDPRVQNAVLLMIATNAVTMGVVTFPVVMSDPDILRKFETVDKLCLVLFTIESSMQLIYHGINLFRDGFLVFDMLIVAMSWTLVNVNAFRAFRIFRVVRLITKIDTLKNLVMALFNVFPKIRAIFMLLLLIFYIFSVMLTQLFKKMYEEDLVEGPYFDTVFYSLFTLFQMLTLDEWAGILLQIQRTYPWAWLPFVLFIFITSFVVVNLIIAVICDAVRDLGTEVKTNLQAPGYAILPPGPAYTSTSRLEELQQKMGEILHVQNQMRATIKVLTRRWGVDGAREGVVSLPIESESSAMMAKYSPGGRRPRSRARSLRNRSRAVRSYGDSLPMQPSRYSSAVVSQSITLPSRTWERDKMDRWF